MTHIADESLPQKQKKVSDQDKAHQMCRHGFHDWVLKDEKVLNKETGEEVAVYKCSLCGKERSRSAH